MDEVEVAEGGKPVEMKHGSTLEVGGSRFILTTRAAVAGPGSPWVGRRKGRCLPTPPIGPSPKEHDTDSSLTEAGPGTMALVRTLDSDTVRLRNPSVGQLAIKQPVSSLPWRQSQCG